MSIVFRTSSGQSLRLGPRLGKGGEAVVQEVVDNSDLAAKIYLPGLAAERREKVLELVASGWHATDKFVACPIDALFERHSGAFAGFTMRKVGGHKPAHELYSPTSRKTSFPNATYPVLLRASSNVARAVASVHAKSCVIGDINHSGVLVRSKDATVTLIDSDSFQVTRSGRTLPCRVGVPEYTPPELQGRSLDNIIRTQNHDAFGLAVLIFYTLFMGRHPYAGRYGGHGDMPMARAIAECRFAYSSNRTATQMTPPPNTPTLADFPLSLSDGFERAFGPAGAHQGSRPTAAEWVQMLGKAEGELVQCSHDGAHHYFKMGPGCPWCRMEQAAPGFRAFSAVNSVPVNGPKLLDLAQFIAAVQAVRDPGPAPTLEDLFPVGPEIKPSAPAISAKAAERQRAMMALVAAFGGLVTLAVAPATPIYGLLAIAGGAFLFFRSPPAYNTVATLNQARSAWGDAVKAFGEAAGNSLFRQTRQEAESLLQQLRQLPDEEAKRLLELDNKRRDAQMRRHLERYTVDKMKLKGFGNVRRQTLKSYGVESAADIDPRRIDSIPGFGESSISALVSWRHSVEASFIFNPGQPADPRDIAAVQGNILKRRSEVQARFGQKITSLQRAVNQAEAFRSNPGTAATQAWTVLKQAEADAKFLGARRSKPARLTAAIVFASVAVLELSSGGFRGFRAKPVPTYTQSLPVQQLGPPTTLESVSPDPKPSPSDLAKADLPPITPSTDGDLPVEQFTPPANVVPIMPNLPGQAASIVAPPILPISGRDASPQIPIDLHNVQRQPSTVSPPIELHNGAIDVSNQDLPIDGRVIDSDSPRLLSLNAIEDSKQVQQRLASLGYLNGKSSGIWGPKSRAALIEFRWAGGLGNDYKWDLETQIALFSEGAIRSPLGRLRD